MYYKDPTVYFTSSQFKWHLVGHNYISYNWILHWFLVCYHELHVIINPILDLQGLPPAVAHVLPLPDPPVHPQPHRRHFRRRHRRHFRRFTGRRPRPIALSISAPRPAYSGYHLRHRISDIVAVSRRVASRRRGRNGGCVSAHAKPSERRIAAAAVWSAAALPYCGDHGDADAGYHCERSRCHLIVKNWEARQQRDLKLQCF